MLLNPLQYAYNFLSLSSQVLNTVTGGASDETFSSRMGRYKRHPKLWKRIIGVPVAGGIDFLLGKGHCERAAQSERENLHRPESVDDEKGD